MPMSLDGVSQEQSRKDAQGQQDHGFTCADFCSRAFRSYLLVGRGIAYYMLHTMATAAMNQKIQRAAIGFHTA